MHGVALRTHPDRPVVEPDYWLMCKPKRGRMAWSLVTSLAALLFVGAALIMASTAGLGFAALVLPGILIIYLLGTVPIFGLPDIWSYLDDRISHGR